MDSEASDSTWKCLWPLVPAHISRRLHRSPWHQGLLHDLKGFSAFIDSCLVKLILAMTANQYTSWGWYGTQAVRFWTLKGHGLRCVACKLWSQRNVWLCWSRIPPQPQGECCRGCVQLRHGAPATPVRKTSNQHHEYCYANVTGQNGKIISS